MKTSGRMHVSASHIVSAARHADWTIDRLSDALPSVSKLMLGRLLNGSAIIKDCNEDGSFTVYVPGHFTGEES